MTILILLGKEVSVVPMSNNYVLYTTHCPRCNVLYSKLKDKNIEFEVSEDVDKLIEMGFMTAPVLYDGEKYYTFEEAMKLINNMG